MGKIRKTEGRFPCHVWEMEDAEKAGYDLKVTEIKNYRSSLNLSDGTKLHDNYALGDSYGTRRLYRCRECGGLVIEQVTMDAYDFDEPDIDRYYIPVRSVQEADLLNILEENVMDTPFRTLYSYTCRSTSYKWLKGKEPVPNDPEELKRKIREKYAGLNPEQKELLEKKMEEAGKEEEGADND